jgi:hypothetical protein
MITHESTRCRHLPLPFTRPAEAVSGDLLVSGVILELSFGAGPMVTVVTFGTATSTLRPDEEVSMRVCPDCEVELVPIKVVDRAQGPVNIGFAYSVDKPKRSAWTGALKNSAGVVQGHLCPQCDRVLFYAVSVE